MNDRFQSLTVFRRVARCGNFTRAGRDMGLSQASVSRIIASLEHDLGAQLVRRTTRIVTLTDSGFDYLARIEPVLDALEEADHFARGEGPLRGHLRIGLSTSFGVRQLIPRLPRFAAQHPDLRIDLAVSDVRQDLLLEGIDVAFRLGALPDSGLVARHIVTSPRILAASPAYLVSKGHPRRPEDLRDHSLIVGPGVTPPILEFRKGERREQVAASGRITCAANEAATALARAGLGITVSSHWGVAEDLLADTLKQILAEWSLPPVELHAVFPPGRAPSPAARACVDFFVDELTAPAASYVRGVNDRTR